MLIEPFVIYAQVNPLCSCPASSSELVGRQKLELPQSGMAFSVFSIFVFIIFVPILAYFLLFLSHVGVQSIMYINLF